MNRFEGRYVLVTGGTGGIGLATAERLVAEGATVLVTGRDAAKIAELRCLVRPCTRPPRARCARP